MNSRALTLVLLVGITSTIASGQASKSETVTTKGGTDKTLPIWKNSKTHPQPTGKVTTLGNSSITEDSEGNVTIEKNNVGIQTKPSTKASLEIAAKGTQGGISVTTRGNGSSNAGNAISGKSEDGKGVSGKSVKQDGVYGETAAEKSAGVEGKNTADFGGIGVKGTATGTGHGVEGDSPLQHGVGVYGQTTDGHGVEGKGAGELSVGVYGSSEAGRGVEGDSNLKGGVVGQSNEGNGVTGVTKSETAAAIYGSGHRAGLFDGNVGVKGTLAVEGTLSVDGPIVGKVKAFRIDYPLDPANKYLEHSSVESSEMINLYSGNVVLDGQGQAVIDLPEWFQALNKDFRYQLTALGAPGPNLYIAEKVRHNRFKIAGGAPGMEVSWQVTGIRHDPWAKAHPLHVEHEKHGIERGRYLNPELFGQPAGKAIAVEDDPNLLWDTKNLSADSVGSENARSAEDAAGAGRQGFDDSVPGQSRDPQLALKKAIDRGTQPNGNGYRINYLEIYEPDVLAEEMQPVLRSAASLFAEK